MEDEKEEFLVFSAQEAKKNRYTLKFFFLSNFFSRLSEIRNSSVIAIMIILSLSRFLNLDPVFAYIK